jgi:hypothetical protein
VSQGVENLASLHRSTLALHYDREREHCHLLPQVESSQSGEKHKGVGGMADTRDPEPVDHEDPRKSISKAPTFEEYMKQKAAAAAAVGN